MPTYIPTYFPTSYPTSGSTANPTRAPNSVISVPVINPDSVNIYAGQRAHISVLANDIPATGTTLHVQTIAKGTAYPTIYPTLSPVSFRFLKGCPVDIIEANLHAFLLLRYNNRRNIPAYIQQRVR